MQRAPGKSGRTYTSLEIAQEDLLTYQTLLELYSAAERTHPEKIANLESEILRLREERIRAPALVKHYRQKVLNQKLKVRELLTNPVGKPILSKREKLIQKFQTAKRKLAELEAEL